MGYPTAYAKGARLLPDELTAPLEATLVRSLTEQELRRTLKVTTNLLTAEIELWNAALADRLRPALTQLTETE
ncbi:hypothetical protein ABZS86_33760 [Streptomyces sp. NPDC005355]|uniref:hypothetical protein n=1 Tax=Streptomyces sp. NPDC005355 TaxID=3157038 RepID=UPI0033B68BE3